MESRSPPQIISIGEARKLLGKKTSNSLSDQQVEDLITQLDYLAKVVIKKYHTKGKFL